MPTNEQDPHRLNLSEGAGQIDIITSRGALPPIGAIATNREVTIPHSGNIPEGEGKETPDLGPDGTVKKLTPAEAYETTAPENPSSMDVLTRISTGEATPDKKSRKGLVAGIAALATVAVATGAFMFTRGGGEEQVAAADNQGDTKASSQTVASAAAPAPVTAEVTPSEVAPTTAAAPTAEATVSAATPEAVVNADGTVSFPVEAFRNDPKALAEAFVTQGLPAWASAGATLKNLAPIYDSLDGEVKGVTTAPKHMPEEARRIAEENAATFADSLFKQGWRNVPELAGTTDFLTTNNERYVFAFLTTANDENAPNPDPEFPIPPVWGQDGKPSYSQTTTIGEVTVDPTSSAIEPVVTVQYEITDNRDDTSLKNSPNTISQPMLIETTSKLSFVAEDGEYKLAGIAQVG